MFFEEGGGVVVAEGIGDGGWSVAVDGHVPRCIASQQHGDRLGVPVASCHVKWSGTIVHGSVHGGTVVQQGGDHLSVPVVSCDEERSGTIVHGSIHGSTTVQQLKSRIAERITVELSAVEHGVTVDDRFRSAEARTSLSRALDSLEMWTRGGRSSRLLCHCRPRRCHGGGIIMIVQQRIRAGPRARQKELLPWDFLP